jgi:predicted DNA-binding transcriptional regulator AlpA
MIKQEIDSPSPLPEKPRIRIVRHKHVCDKLGVSAPKLFDMIAKGDIDKPFKIIPGGRACGWLEHEIDAWILNRKDDQIPPNLCMAGNNPRKESEPHRNKIVLTKGNKMAKLVTMEKTMSEYLSYCYNETPDQMLVVKDGVEMSVTDWCAHFGGKPEGQTNFDFLQEKFDAFRCEETRE